MKRDMLCVEIISLKTNLHRVVDILQDVGCLDIESIEVFPDITARPFTIDANILRRQEELRLLMAEIEGELHLLGGERNGFIPIPDKQDWEIEMRQALNVLSPQIVGITTRRDALQSELESLPRYEATLLKLLPAVPLTAYEEGKSLIGLLISRSHLDILDIIRQEVAQLSDGQSDFIERNIDEATRALLMIVPPNHLSDVELLLGKKDVTRLRLPKQLEKGSLDATLTALRLRMRDIPLELAKLDQSIESLTQEWGEKLTIWCRYLHDRLSALNVLSQFGETDKTCIIVGWVPKEDFENLSNALYRGIGDAIFIAKKEITDDIKAFVPVALDNPAAIRPFESLVKIQAIPRNDGIDPTGLMALFMPIFFGMMVGDIGYGLILLLIIIGLMRKITNPTMRDLLKILGIGSAWSIVFGFLFGELFGTLGEYIGLHPILFDRADAEYIISLMALTLAIGAGHITLGLILGVWEAIKRKSRSHLLERGGMLIGLIGVFVIVAALLELLPSGLMTPGVVILILGIVLLSSSMGWIGVLMGSIEFIGVISNLLSYLRIAAIGLASVFLAKVANDLAGIAGSLIIGLIIASLFHALNIALGAFSPTIQSLRLHYVEFFPKFYEGGGRLYEPFRSRLKCPV